MPKSMPDNKKKLKLGKKEEGEYKFHSKIDFSKDLDSQIENMMEEQRIENLLKEHIELIRNTLPAFENKEKNLRYYYELGKLFAFLRETEFQNVKPFTVLRRIAEEVEDLLPELEKKRKQDHLMMMFRIGRLNYDLIEKATWSQWYEITKFSNVSDDDELLSKLLANIHSANGPQLRKIIKELVQHQSQQKAD